MVSTREGTRTIGVAIAVPDPWGSELRAWRARLGDPLAAAIPTHVTLLPPTQVGEGALATAEQHLRRIAAAAEPFEIHLRGSGTFRPVSPVVFVQLSRGTGECERIEAKVRSGPLARPLAFPYHPHVTVAHHLPGDALDLAFDKLADYEAVFDADGFGLFTHGPDGLWRLDQHFSFPRPGPAA